MAQRCLAFLLLVNETNYLLDYVLCVSFPAKTTRWSAFDKKQACLVNRLAAQLLFAKSKVEDYEAGQNILFF